MKRKIGITAYFLLLLIFIFLSIAFYLSKDNYQPTIDDFLRNPEKYKGKNAEFVGGVLNVSLDSFYMMVNQRPLKVHYTGLEKPNLGQVYAMVKLNGDGTATAMDVHRQSYNYIKYFVSLLGFILFLVIFFKEWKFRKWRFVENA